MLKNGIIIEPDLEEKVRAEKGSTFSGIQTFFRSNFFPTPNDPASAGYL